VSASVPPDALLAAVQAGVDVVDLGRQLRVGMPQSPNHPQFWHTLPRRHGDMTRADGGSAANDMITTGTHVGTHIDALAHVSHDGRLHGGADAEAAGRGGS
jgi:kynurenine formamidase